MPVGCVDATLEQQLFKVGGTPLCHGAGPAFVDFPVIEFGQQRHRLFIRSRGEGVGDEAVAVTQSLQRPLVRFPQTLEGDGIIVRPRYLEQLGVLAFEGALVRAGQQIVHVQHRQPFFQGGRAMITVPAR